MLSEIFCSFPAGIGCGGYPPQPRDPSLSLRVTIRENLWRARAFLFAPQNRKNPSPKPSPSDAMALEGIKCLAENFRGLFFDYSASFWRLFLNKNEEHPEEYRQ